MYLFPGSQCSILYFTFILLDGVSGAYNLRDFITKISWTLLDIHELLVHTLAGRICKNAFTKTLCLQTYEQKCKYFNTDF